MSAVEKSIAMYDRGKTTVYACQFDQRFAYCCYVPADYSPAIVDDLVAAVLRERLKADLGRPRGD